MKKLIILFCISCILLASCDDAQKTKKRNVSLLVKAENKIEIQFPDTIQTPTAFPQYFDDYDGKKVLACLNFMTSSIYLLNLDKQKLMKEIKVPLGDSNQLRGNLSGYSFLNDSLIIVALNMPNFGLINAKGQLIKYFDGLQVNGKFTSPRIAQAASASIRDNKIYYPLFPRRRPKSCEEADEMILHGCISLDDFSLTMAKPDLPSGFCLKKSQFYYHYGTYTDSSYIYSFTRSNFLYKYKNMNSNEFVKVLAKSKYAPDEIDPEAHTAVSKKLPVSTVIFFMINTGRFTIEFLSQNRIAQTEEI